MSKKKVRKGSSSPVKIKELSSVPKKVLNVVKCKLVYVKDKAVQATKILSKKQKEVKAQGVLAGYADELIETINAAKTKNDMYALSRTLKKHAKQVEVIARNI